MKDGGVSCSPLFILFTALYHSILKSYQQLGALCISEAEILVGKGLFIYTDYILLVSLQYCACK